MEKKQKPCTQWIVDLAMLITSKEVRSPKCVRDGIVKPKPPKPIK